MSGLEHGLLNGLGTGLHGNNQVGQGLANGLYGDTRSTIALLRGLVSYYKFNGDAIDSVSPAMNGTAANMTFTTGKINNAAVFNGSNGKITFFPSNTKLTILKNNFTIAFWMNTNGGLEQMLIDNTNNGAGSGFFCDYRGDNAAKFLDIRLFDINSGASNRLNTTVAMNGSVWRHVTVVREGLYFRAYINGALNTFTTIRDNRTFESSSNNLVLGSTSSGLWYNGMLDEMGFWNRALTPNEIVFLYREGYGLSYPFS